MTSAQWKAAQQGMGAGKAKQWAAENGIDVNDDLAVRQQSGAAMEEDDEELPAVESDPQAGFGVPGMTAPLAVKPEGSLAVNGAPKRPDPLAVLEQSQQSVSKLYDDAASRLEAQYQGPNTNDLLLQIGAALMQPTESGRFMDALANAAQVVPAWAKGKRESQNEMLKARTGFDLQKAQALAGLQEKYITGSMKAPGMQWSESLQRFIPKDRAVVLRAGDMGGKHTEEMSDGSIRVYDAPGVYTSYDAGGNPIEGGA